MAKAKKFYVVWKGHQTGVFDNWDSCKAQVQGFEGAVFKSFGSQSEAQIAFSQGAKNYFGSSGTAKNAHKSKSDVGLPIKNSLSVDAACSGNPGDMEYQGVWTQNGQRIFHQGPFKKGTNNIGEFLAIVHALAHLKKNNLKIPVYTDSKTAIAWVKKKKANTKLPRSNANEKLFELIERAEKWLQQNTYDTVILKWETEVWGEIPADFGRK